MRFGWSRMNLTEFRCRHLASCLQTNLNEESLYHYYFVYIDTNSFQYKTVIQNTVYFKTSFYISIVLEYNMAQSANF